MACFTISQRPPFSNLALVHANANTVLHGTLQARLLFSPFPASLASPILLGLVSSSSTAPPACQLPPSPSPPPPTRPLLCCYHPPLPPLPHRALALRFLTRAETYLSFSYFVSSSTSLHRKLTPAHDSRAYLVPPPPTPIVHESELWSVVTTASSARKRPQKTLLDTSVASRRRFPHSTWDLKVSSFSPPSTLDALSLALLPLDLHAAAIREDARWEL